MKTADEMFRELGYTRTEWKPGGLIAYMRGGFDDASVEINTKRKDVISFMGYDSGRFITFDEIRAVAKLLDELEARDD